MDQPCWEAGKGETKGKDFSNTQKWEEISQENKERKIQGEPWEEQCLQVERGGVS